MSKYRTVSFPCPLTFFVKDMGQVMEQGWPSAQHPSREIPLRFWEEKETNDKVVGPQKRPVTNDWKDWVDRCGRAKAPVLLLENSSQLPEQDSRSPGARWRVGLPGSLCPDE